MTQSELNRAVASVTGETVREIGHRGFSLADPDNVNFDPEPRELDKYLEWDDVDSERQLLVAG